MPDFLKLHMQWCCAGQTCCCMRDFFGYCFAWACCPLKQATCCDDHIHCCPNSLPVCDTVAARCLAAPGAGYEGSVPWSTKTPAFQVHFELDTRTLHVATIPKLHLFQASLPWTQMATVAAGVPHPYEVLPYRTSSTRDVLFHCQQA